MLAHGVPTLAYGLRGMAALELKVTGPKIDLHSGLFGGAVANPITALVQLLSTLHDREGRVAVRGFTRGSATRRMGARILEETADRLGQSDAARKRIAWAIRRKRLHHPRTTLGAPNGRDQWNRWRLPRDGNQDCHPKFRDGENYLPARARQNPPEILEFLQKHFAKICRPMTRWKSHPAMLVRGIWPIRILRMVKRRNAPCAKSSRRSRAHSRRRKHSDRGGVSRYPRRGIPAPWSGFAGLPDALT